MPRSNRNRAERAALDERFAALVGGEDDRESVMLPFQPRGNFVRDR